MRKKSAALGGALSALLVGGVLLAPAASAQTGDSAFGVAAAGIVDVPPTPFVEGEGEESLVDVDLDIIAAEALAVEASQGYALSTVANAGVSVDQLPAIEATAIEAECDDLTGSVTIADLTIGDQSITVDQIPPNTEVIPAELAGIASITLNKQVESDGVLSVTAIAINVLDGTQTVDIAQANCTAAGEEPPGEEPPGEEPPGEEPPGEEPPGEEPPGDGDGDGDGGAGGGGDAGGDDAAPAPTPQDGHLDVTG